MPRRWRLPLIVMLVAALRSVPAGAAAPSARSYDALLALAREALARDDAASALDLLDQALRLDPDGGHGFVLLATVYTQLERHAEATAALRRAARLLGEGTPDGQEALCSLAASLVREERNVEAIETLQRVIALSPRRSGLHHDLGQIHLALGRLEAARDEFTAEIRRAREGGAEAGEAEARVLAASHEGLGIAAYRLGDDDAALAALPQAGDRPEATYHLGLALARRGRHKEAASALRSVLAKEPDHRGALQNLGRVAASLGLEEERDRSLARFQELYRLEEGRRRVQNSIHRMRTEAERQTAAGEMRSAVATLEEALRLDPGDVEILMDLGRIHQRAGEARRAEEVLRKAIAIQPLLAEAHYRLGRLQADAANLNAAVASLESAVRCEPTSTTYHIHLAQLYMRTGRSDDAVRELRLVRRLRPEDPDGSFNLGLGLAQAGRLQEAAAELEEAIRLGYGEPQIHRVLSRVYEGLGDAERSARERRAYESATKDEP